ncbi:hypothetical protein J6590_039533 [Homalodisca vitripennis]|nr:hypothetical protein J6590_039533 [Homalodisca vitripennis]
MESPPQSQAKATTLLTIMWTNTLSTCGLRLVKNNSNESARGRLLRQTIASPRGLDTPPDHPRSRGHRRDTTTSQLCDKPQLPLLRYICNESARGRMLRQTIASPRGLDTPPDHPRSRGHRRDTTTSQLCDKPQLPLLKYICNILIHYLSIR